MTPKEEDSDDKTEYLELDLRRVKEVEGESQDVARAQGKMTDKVSALDFM
jgi:hypothetical protein